MLVLRLPGGPPALLCVPARRALACRVASCASDIACPKWLPDNWGKKAIGRKTTGTGRCRYLKDMPRKFKNGFREGAHPAARIRANPARAGDGAAGALAGRRLASRRRRRTRTA